MKCQSCWQPARSVECVGGIMQCGPCAERYHDPCPSCGKAPCHKTREAGAEYCGTCAMGKSYDRHSRAAQQHRKVARLCRELGKIERAKRHEARADYHDSVFN